jgi:probable rRNA maturation factor
VERAQHHIRSLSLAKVPAAAALKKAELSILLCHDEAIQELNRRWRAKDKATDVLSFPMQDAESLKLITKMAKQPKFPAWELGDIVISVDTAKRQAREHGLTLPEELELLLVHGVLHLLGFDHELGDKEERAMRRWEKKLLGRDGLTSVLPIDA